MRVLPFIAASLFAASTPALAQEVPYGPAGCGLGSIIMGNDADLLQLVAITTNNISFNQALGITFGTLGCDVGGNGRSARIFVEGNREALARDISRGSGETLATLAHIGGCSSDTALGGYLQGRFDLIFPNAQVSDATVAEGVVGLMRAPEAPSCTLLQTGA
jgi:hypothetical protein